MFSKLAIDCTVLPLLPGSALTAASTAVCTSKSLNGPGADSGGVGGPAPGDRGNALTAATEAALIRACQSLWPPVIEPDWSRDDSAFSFFETTPGAWL